ncbi:hypothetical protein N7489_008578 [Penicillium chrysogenum]|uniref:uncharacterized protein n=1 Tax=Penicillium chrysogenum TaxID=5076 RepID=UPI0024DF097B|nr:uncharacterized protein N7489_008578 [Penicillium chrysogenum]KAJ5227870.1 hypothetical protein N7489_008578 [Penicillium chrysogenum]
MLSSLAFSLPLLLAGLQATAVGASPSVSAVGSKFFYENGTQFYVKGIAYQLTPSDPLIDTAQCKRDIARMSELGTNAIRVYHVDPHADHKGCMSALADAGIHLFVDLDTFNTQIEQTEPHWNQTQFDHFKEVLDEFQKFDNTAGVFVGNEVLTTANGSAAAPYVLAAARDIKAYRDQKGYREIPVELYGLFQECIRALGLLLAECLRMVRCVQTQSGYNILQKNATDYPIPIFFSETGCNTPSPRTFEDQAAIFGDNMSDTWSGSMVYEWIEETNDYGLISYGPSVDAATATASSIEDGFTRKGTPTPVLPDFNNLKSQWATLHPTGVALSVYKKSASSLAAIECPASTSGGWAIDPSSPLPTLGQTFKQGTDSTATGKNDKASKVTANGAPSASATKEGGAYAVTVSSPATERLLAGSLLLSGLLGVVAIWL